jgi:hypothetical protein
MPIPLIRVFRRPQENLHVQNGSAVGSAFDSDCSGGVHVLSRLAYTSLLSPNTHINSSLQHSKTSPRYWNADQSLQHSSAEHLLHISAHLDRQASLTCRFAVGIEFPSLPDFASLQNLHSTTNLSRTLTSPTHHQTHNKHIIKMEYNTGAPTGGRACYNCELLAHNPSPGALCLLRARHRVLRPALDSLERSASDCLAPTAST